MVRIEVIEYRLRHIESGKFITVEESSNDGADFCYDVQYILSKYQDYPIYVADSAEHAEWVRNNNTPWFNATYDSPTNDFKAKELEVVAVKMIVDSEEEVMSVQLPTKLEIYQTKLLRDKGYKRIIESYLEECKRKNIDTSNDFVYSCGELYDYNFIRERLKIENK
jgi:hypothetical protein